MTRLNVVETLCDIIKNGEITNTDMAAKMERYLKIIGFFPNCQKNIIDKGEFYGSIGYKEGCKFSLPKQWSSKTLTKKNISDLLTKKETTTIKGFKNKKGTSFNAKLQLKDNKLEFIFDNKK